MKTNKSLWNVPISVHTEASKLEQLYHSWMSTSNDAIIIIDKDEKITFWNDASVQFFGYQPKEVIGEHINFLIPTTLNDEKNDQLKQAVFNQKIAGYQTSRLHQDGQAIPVFVHYIPIHDVEGNLHSVIKIIKKIDLIEPQFLHNIHNNPVNFVEKSIEGVMFLSKEAKPLYVSPAIKKLLGYTAEEFLNLSVDEVAHPADLPQIIKLWQQVIEHPGKAIYGQPARFKHKNGKWRWFASYKKNELHNPNFQVVIDTFWDVTTQVEADAVLKSLNHIINNAIEAFILIDETGKIIRINKSTCKYLGYTKKELLSKYIWEISTKITKKDFNSLWYKTLQEKKQNQESFHKAKSGKLIPVELSYGFFNSLGKTYAFEFVRDISEKKEKEELLKTTNSLNNMLTEINNIIIYAKTEDEIYRHAAKMLHEFTKIDSVLFGIVNHNTKLVEFNYSVGQLKHNTAQKSVTVSFDEKLEIGNGIIGISIRNKKLEFTNNFLRDTRLKIWYEAAKQLGYNSVLSLPIYKQQKPFGVFVLSSAQKNFFNKLNLEYLQKIAENISFAFDRLEQEREQELAKKEIEEKETFLRNIINSLNSCIAVVNQDGVIIKANNFWRMMAVSSYKSKLLLSFEGDNFFTQTEIAAKQGSVFHQVIAKGISEVAYGKKTMFHEQVFIEVLNEQKWWFSIKIMKFIAVEGLVIIEITDNTDLKKTEEELTQTKAVNEKLLVAEVELNKALIKEKELNDLKSNFVATASHEFRTPLTSITTSLQLIKKYIRLYDCDNVEKHVGKIEQTVEQMMFILESFLDLSKLEEGKINNQPKLLGLNNLINLVISQCKVREHTNRKIELISSNEDEVFVDEKLLKNTLINLISNALKYSPLDMPVTIKTDIKQEYFSISVTDYGIGISEEEQDKIFDRFFRSSQVSAVQGTGLGLSIVSKYLQIMNGQITINSKPHQGSTFTIIIPQYHA